MTTTPDEPLRDDQIESTGMGVTGSGTSGHDADTADQTDVDADGTDSADADGTDSSDADSSDGADSTAL